MCRSWRDAGRRARMDPMTTLHDLLEALGFEDHGRAEELAQALQGWLANGGLSPFAEAQTYNGWSNYETWCVHLWLTGDQGRYRQSRSMVQDLCRTAGRCDAVLNGIWTEAQARTFLLADALKETVAAN